MFNQSSETRCDRLDYNFQFFTPFLPYDLKVHESEASVFPWPVDVELGLGHTIFLANRMWAKLIC